jgi:hypothetical protein
LRLDGVAKAYVNNCRANGKAGKWLDDLLNLLQKHWLSRLTQKPCDQLTRDDINQFMNRNYAHVKQIIRNRYRDYLSVI